MPLPTALACALANAGFDADPQARIARWLDVTAGQPDGVPTVVINLNAGAIHEVTSDARVRVVIHDGDTQGADDARLVQIDGEDYYVYDGVTTEPLSDFDHALLQACDDLAAQANDAAAY